MLDTVFTVSRAIVFEKFFLIIFKDIKYNFSIYTIQKV